MPRLAALEALRRVEDEGLRAADVVEHEAGRRQLGARDRALALELAQGVLRHLGQLDAVLAGRTRRPLDRTDAKLRRILRLGTYQLLFLDRVPARAAVHTSVELARQAGRGGGDAFVNAVLRGVLRLREGVGPEGEGPPRRTLPRGDGTEVRLSADVLPDPEVDDPGHLAARWAHPRWLVERFLAQHRRPATLGILAAGLARPTLSLRPAAGREEALGEALSARGLPWEREGPCLVLGAAVPVVGLPGWDAGWFWVQGPTAAEVVPLLDPQPGDDVLELCAAPGGKTLGLAEAVGDGGAVLAVDLPGPRTGLLRAELVRRGIANVALLEADATESGELPTACRGRVGFPLVLVDVPCSNTGVLGRRVEARHRLTGPGAIRELRDLQLRLLGAGASRLRPGGRLCYSTCSVDSDENGRVVRSLLRRNRELRLSVERLTLPVAGRRDGGYAAIVRRRG